MNTTPLKTYADAENFLFGMINYEHKLGKPSELKYDTKTFDLQRFRGQLSQLGDPHGHYAVIHIAGTKGKGSTAAFLERTLRQAGLKTGFYSSPHMKKFTERIRINGEEMTDSDFANLLDEMRSALQPAQPTPQAADGAANNTNFRTVFEILTASAFVWFQRQNVDVAIIETGLGGRLDSTNSFQDFGTDHPFPIVQIISTLGLDHTAILGNTIQEITSEKGGILTRGGIGVIGYQQPHYRQDTVPVLQHIAMAKGQASIIDVPAYAHIEPRGTGAFVRMDPPELFDAEDAENENPAGTVAKILQTGIEIHPGLQGQHQIGNAVTALAALSALEIHPAFAGWKGRALWESAITAETLQTGISETRWFGRFTVVNATPLFVLDGAHCPLSAAALAETLNREYPEKPVTALCAFMADKNAADLVTAFFKTRPFAHAVTCAVPNNPRTLSADGAAKIVSQSAPNAQIVSAPTVEDAVHLAADTAKQNNGIAVVFGSLFILAPVYDILTKQ